MPRGGCGRGGGGRAAAGAWMGVQGGSPRASVVRARLKIGELPMRDAIPPWLRRRARVRRARLSFGAAVVPRCTHLDSDAAACGQRAQRRVRPPLPPWPTRFDGLARAFPAFAEDSYSAAYYYLQMTDGTTEFAGIEVFMEGHTHEKGDVLTVHGVVRESYGVTEIVECSFTKTGSMNVPDPIEITTDDLQGCTIAGEKYEGMVRWQNGSNSRLTAIRPARVTLT